MFRSCAEKLRPIAARAVWALLIAVLLTTSCATGQMGAVGYRVVWSRSLVDDKYQLPRPLIRTSGGGYAVAGYGSAELVPGSVGSSTGFWTLKLDRDGKIIWQRAFAAERPKREEKADTLVETRDGGLLVVGVTSSDFLAGRSLGDTNNPQSTSLSDVGLAVKYNQDGTLAWKKALGKPDGKPSDWFYASISMDSGYLLAGRTMMLHKDPSTPSGKNPAWVLRLLKINDLGEAIWDKTIPDGDHSIPSESISRKIIPTSDGGFVIAMAPADNSYPTARRMNIVSDTGSVVGNSVSQRAVILKMDSEGRVIKRSEFPASTAHVALGSNSNGYIVSGYDSLLWYAFFDNELNMKWRKTVIPGIIINAFQPAPDGGFYAVGATSQVAIAHISPTGEFRQQTVSGTPRGSEARDVAAADRPDEFVILWSRIPRTRAGLMKLRVPLQ